MVSASSKPSTRSSNRVTKSKATDSTSATQSTKRPTKKASRRKQPAKSKRRTKKAKSPTPEDDDDDEDDDSDEEDDNEEEETKPTKKNSKRGGAQKTRTTTTTKASTTRSRRALASENNAAAADREATASPPPSPISSNDQDSTAGDLKGFTPAAESSQTQTQTDEELARALQRAESESTGRQRKTRSRTGRIRHQTDLSSFFPNYEEVMGFEKPKETEFLDLDAEIMVVDDEESQSDEPEGSPQVEAADEPSSQAQQAGEGSSQGQAADEGPSKGEAAEVPSQGQAAGEGSSNTRHDDSPKEDSAANPDGNETAAPSTEEPRASTRLLNVQHVDLSSVQTSSRGKDPLIETMYAVIHQRGEQREKRLQNIERDKAQHETEGLERLLEGLKGADWLRVLGLSGLTEAEKKEYLPKRTYFIKEATALVGRLKAWRDEEKRRKLGNDKKEPVKEEETGKKKKKKKLTKGKKPAKLAQYDGADEYDASGDDGSDSDDEDQKSEGDPPECSDVDAQAARQLHLEAIMATGGLSDVAEPSHRRGTKRKREDDPESEPVTSFFAKRYQRDAALGNHRRSGRGSLAFGQPTPDMPPRDFHLPEDILNEDAISTRARLRRRLRRGV